jgi:hypothetical protein
VSALTWTSPADAVLTIEPVPDTMRMLRPDAKFALVETYMGESFTVTTDDQCPFGIEKAAVAWAEATGAAYLSREAS